MGGSAIAGNLVSDLIAASPAPALRSRPPIIVVRGMEFPFSLDRRSLVVLCSYSGDTGETISLFHQARDSGARVLVVAGGGRLAQAALKNGLPFLRVDTPGEPRSAVGYSLMLLAAAFNKLGLTNIAAPEVTASIASLEQRVAGWAENVPTQDNSAKQLALTLNNRVVVVYGGGLFAGMARRWKTQLNENAKAWAFFEEIPELLHNAVEAFPAPTCPDQGLTALLLRPNVSNDPLAPHYAAAENALDRSGVPVKVLKGDPEESPLSQLLGMLALGDHVSYYLAMLRGVDPSPTSNILHSKDFLSGRTG